MTVFWVVVGIVVGLAVVAVLAGFAMTQFFDDGNKLLGTLSAAGAVVVLAGGMAWLVHLDSDPDRVCVKESIVIINNHPYSVCDEYAERVR